MVTRGGAKIYATTHYTSMSPGQLVLALFEGAVTAVTKAEGALETNDVQKRGEATSKALAIVGELQASLRLDAGEVAENLSLLYDYVSRELVRANLQKDAKTFAEARRILEQLKDTWAEMLASMAAGEPEAAEEPKLAAAGGSGSRYL